MTGRALSGRQLLGHDGSVTTLHRTYSGKVAYIGDTVGERGREWFTVSVGPTGSRTVQARCEIDDSQVLRHVHYSVDAQWRPLDAHIRLEVGGAFLGTGWFRFDPVSSDGGGLAECETQMRDGGRVSQRMERSAGSTFGAHPVVCDVWHLGAHPPATCLPGVARGHTAFMSSLLPNGASGPMLSTMTYDVVYEADESVTVPAGTFDTHHYRYVFSDGHADEHIWYTSDDLILVQIRWDLLSTTYQLVELDR